MAQILSTFEERGWDTFECFQSGVRLELPFGLQKKGLQMLECNGLSQSWKNVPPEMSRTGSGMTADSYGGQTCNNTSQD
jgi:hypothetical protein